MPLFTETSVLFFASMLARQSWLSKLHQLPAVLWIGRRSYSMYLVHVLCLNVFESRVRINSGPARRLACWPRLSASPPESLRYSTGSWSSPCAATAEPSSRGAMRSSQRSEAALKLNSPRSRIWSQETPQAVAGATAAISCQVSSRSRDCIVKAAHGADYREPLFDQVGAPSIEQHAEACAFHAVGGEHAADQLVAAHTARHVICRASRSKIVSNARDNVRAAAKARSGSRSPSAWPRPATAPAACRSRCDPAAASSFVPG